MLFLGDFVMPHQQKKRILWISDSPAQLTGNGKITRNFIRGMNATGLYDVAVLGRGYSGRPEELEKYGCAIFPMNI